VVVPPTPCLLWSAGRLFPPSTSATIKASSAQNRVDSSQSPVPPKLGKLRVVAGSLTTYTDFATVLLAVAIIFTIRFTPRAHQTNEQPSSNHGLSQCQLSQVIRTDGKPIKHLTKLLSHEHVVGQLTHRPAAHSCPLQTVFCYSANTRRPSSGVRQKGIIAMTFVKPISDRTRKSA